MKSLLRYVAVALVAGLLGYLAASFPARNGVATSGTESPRPVPEEDTGQGDDLVFADSVSSLPRSLVVDTVFDLSGDGATEIVRLYVDAERNPDGDFLWDDGQRWLLVVRIGERTYPLFDEFVQLGDLRFRVIERGAGEQPVIVLLQRAGAGVRLFSYMYDPERNAFVRRLEYQATGNTVFSSPDIGVL